MAKTSRRQRSETPLARIFGRALAQAEAQRSQGQMRAVLAGYIH